MIDFSSLKSGIPYLNSPPIFLSLSKTSTVWPTLFNCWAAANPAGPDPTTAIFLFVLLLGAFAFIHPSSKPLSTIYFSIISIETGGLINPNTQAASHGAGHNLPVNSGKLFVECKMSRASFHSFLYTASLKSGIKFPSGHPEWQNGTPQSIHLPPCSTISDWSGVIVNSL